MPLARSLTSLGLWELPLSRMESASIPQNQLSLIPNLLCILSDAVLKNSLKELSGLLSIVQLSRFSCLLSSATAYLEYHIRFSLSTVFFVFPNFFLSTRSPYLFFPVNESYLITGFRNCQYCFFFLFISDNSHNSFP